MRGVHDLSLSVIVHLVGQLLSSTGIEDGGSIPSGFPGSHDTTDEYCVGCRSEQITITLCYTIEGELGYM